MATAFFEQQKFRQLWLWLLIVPSCLGGAGVLAYGLFVQIVLGTPWGNEPLPDFALIAIAVPAVLLLIGFFVWFIYSGLRTYLQDGIVHIEFPPVVHRKINVADIQDYHARTYRPLREYGGWGIRWSPHGMAYNVSGNSGVQLRLKNGKRVLIGSKRPNELEAAIGSAIDELNEGAR